jgi:hypothetical protein
MRTDENVLVLDVVADENVLMFRAGAMRTERSSLRTQAKHLLPSPLLFGTYQYRLGRAMRKRSRETL